MSNIEKEYVDYSGLQEYDGLIKGVISTDFVGATSSTDGVAGRVPAPQIGDENKYLRGDGTWNTPTGGVTGVKGSDEIRYRSGNVSISKGNIGLGSVDNTSDANKPISTKQQSAFNALIDSNSYNVIPTDGLSSCTVLGVTITNNNDGSLTLDGTAEGYVYIDFLGGKISGNPPDITEPFSLINFLKSYRTYWVLSINADADSFPGTLYMMSENPKQYGLSGLSVNSSSPIARFYPYSALPYEYLRIYFTLKTGDVCNNLTIKPSLIPESEMTGGIVKGAMSNYMITEYLQKRTLPTFKGTAAEWNALHQNEKCHYRLVILSDD